jgi:DNA-binding SARP family transcriptional activator/tetratricopeptide (TPR) repeat protein
VRVRVLGPMEVEIAGTAIGLGGRLPRQLFAALVVRAGESVSVPALVDAVWGESAPRSAVRTLRAYVTRLRSALEAAGLPKDPDAGTAIIQTTRQGYRLAVAPDIVDAHVFADRVQQARHELDAGRPAAAEASIAEASALWRGTPYGEFSEAAFFTAEALRLTETRILGVEIRIEAALMGGQHSAALTQAEVACAEHPLHERFWAQLMIALYRCGRPTDALDAYHRLRRHLAEEIGTDPAPSLRRLEQLVLQHDPSLDAPMIEPVRVAAPVSVPEAAARADHVPERQLVTVLVAAAGPVAGGGWADPERADAAFRTVRAAFADAVRAAGGVHAGTAGHNLIAAFGVLPGQDDHAVRALRAALTACEAVPAGVASVSLGVATGVVVYRREGDAPEVTGDPVRTASTLCTTAGANQIAVAERTVAAARAEFRFGPMTSGTGPHPIAQATLLAPGPSRPQHRLGHRFVGRRDELDALESAYHRSIEFSRPHLVTVVGDAGMGKSTLIARFIDHLRSAAHPTPAVYSGRCLSQGVAATYGAAAEVLRVFLGLEQDAPTAEIERVIAGNEILGLTFGLDTAGDLDPRTARHKLQEAWIRLIEPHTPAAVVVEDVHWASSPLLDLLNRLVAEVAGALLVVCTARPEYAESSEVGLRPRHQVLWLDRLNESHAATLLKELLHDEPPDTIRHGILDQAEGNPFFIEELTATLVDRRVLVRSDNRWRIEGDATDAPLPDSVHSALAARINYLHSGSRTTLLAASVAGRNFTTSEVAHLLDGEPTIPELVERDFIRPLRRTATATTYTFKHALTRQVAYDLLPVRRRARLHAKLADHFADRTDLDDRAGVLAHHYGEAARPDTADLAWYDDAAELERLTDRAITWLWEAGKLAARRLAVDDALDLLQRAQALATEPVAHARIWRSIAEAHAERLDGRRYLDALQHSLDVCSEPQEQAEAYILMGNMVTAWGIVSAEMPDPPTVLAWYDRALALSRPGTNAHTWALVLRASFDHTLLAALAKDAYAEAQRTDDFDYMADAHTLQILLAARERRYDDMLEWTMKRHAGELAHANGDPYLQGDCFVHVAMPLMHLGRFDEARQYLTRNQKVASHLSPANKADAVAWWIELEALANEWGRVRNLEPALQSFADDDLARCRVRVSRAVVLCAIARIHLGDPEHGEALVRQADEMAGGHDDRIAATYVELALARGDLDAVRNLMGRLPKSLPPWGGWWVLHLETTRLNAIAALGDTAAAEEETRTHLDTGVFLDAVAKQALGTVHHDPELLHAAADAFTRMNLPALALRARAVIERQL